jgi:hypothetical protein
MPTPMSSSKKTVFWDIHKKKENNKKRIPISKDVNMTWQSPVRQSSSQGQGLIDAFKD